MTISSQIEKLGSLEDQLMSSIKERSLEKDLAYNKFIYKDSKFRSNADVTFDELCAYEIGREFYFHYDTYGDITSQRVMTSNPNKIVFKTTFGLKSVLTRHRHSDCCEKITLEHPEDDEILVTTGTEMAGDYKTVILNKDNPYISIKQGVTHQVYNRKRKKANLIIEFERFC